MSAPADELKPHHHLAKALERIQTAKCQSFVSRIPQDPLGFDMVVCHCCREPIRKMVPDDRYRETKEVNGKTVIYERLLMVSLPNYAHVLIRFDDGTDHIHAMCRDCAERPDLDLESLYAHVLHDWLIDEQLGGGAVRWDLAAHRKPISKELVGASS